MLQIIGVFVGLLLLLALSESDYQGKYQTTYKALCEAHGWIPEYMDYHEQSIVETETEDALNRMGIYQP